MEDNPAYKALDQIGWGKYNLRVFLICGSVILIKALVVYESMFVGMAYILQGVQEEWGVSPVFLGIIASLYHVGMLFGNLTWGFLSDKKGRKFPFRMSSILALVSIILICSSVHPYMMCASILLLGYSLSGEMSLSATVFCEFCPPSRRHLLALLYFNISVGAILVSVIALVVVLLNHTPFYDWRIICAAILVLIVFNTILRFFIEESPPFLFRNKNFEQAEAILNQVSMTNKKEEFDFNDTNSVLDPTSQQGKESVYSSLITEIEENPPISVLFKRIFSRRLLPTTLKLSFVKFTQAMNLAILAFASFINFMPELLGFMSTSDTYLVMMIQQAVGIPGAWLGAQLVKTKMGRKWTTSAGFLGAGLFDLLFMLRQEFYFATVTSSLVFLFTNMGYSALYTLSSESFPTQVRSTGTNFLSIFSRIGGIAGPIISGVLLSRTGGVFILMCLLAAANVGCSIIVTTLKETRSGKENRIFNH